MYLKEIEIKGFKSFANKIKLTITPGITVIVGPNGCGKSNITDAVRWILGEQNIRSLRGNKIIDMIFSGNEEQKMRNYAQVSLLFDNADRKLSVDSEEVELKRVIYRSGDIENYINGIPCKLKDIQELFWGTGLGKNSYSIIAQGKVDFVLNAKPAERRMLFEEASDVALYRNKREDTLKKLDLVENNLLRINDILKEVEETLIHYKKKSDDLKAYRLCQENIQKLEYYMLSHQYLLLQKSSTKNNKKLSFLKNEISQVEKTILHNKTNISQLEQQKEQLEQQLNENIKLYQESEIDKNRVINQLASIKQQESEINQLLNNIQEDIKYADSQYKSFKDNLSDLEKDIQETYHNEKICEDKLKNESILLRNYNHLHDYYQQKIKTIETKDMLFEKYYHKYREDKIKKETEIESLNLSLFKIGQEQESINKKLDDYQKLVKDVEKELPALGENIKQLEAEKREIEKELKAKEVLIEKEKELIQNYQNDLNLKNKEKDFLEEYLKNNQQKNKKIEDNHFIKESLPEVIFYEEINNLILEIPDYLKNIFHFILEEGTKIIQVTHSDQIANLNQLLKENNIGKIKIIADNIISLTKTDLERVKIKENFKKEKIIGFAQELISYPNEYKHLFELILDHILIVEDMSTAFHLFEKLNGQWIIISLDGIVIDQKGIISLNFEFNDKVKDSNFLTSNRVLSLKQEIKYISNQIKIKNVDLNDQNVKYYKLNDNLKSVIKQLEYYLSEYSRNKSKLTEIEKNITDLENLLKTLDNQKIEEQEKKKILVEELKTIILFLKHIEKYLKEYSSYLNCLARYQVSCNKNINEIKKNIENMTMKINWNKERAKLLQERKQEMSHFMQNNQQEENKRQDKLQHYNKELLLLNNERDALKEKLNFIIINQEKANDSINKIKANLKEKENMLSKARENMEINQKKLDQMKNALHEGELLKVQYQEKINHLFYTIENQYNSSLNEVLSSKNYAQNQKEALNQITQYKEQIKLMGQINFDADQEYQEQYARYTELKSKKEEIRQAKEKLIYLINEIDQIAENHFYQTFLAVHNNFKDIFQKLFQGGQASLEFTNGRKLLEAGIEVMAQPPGKKIQNISLLSTGEKALTAIALLFALWKANPTPFCFFDEIDSALDEANAIRLASFLKKEEFRDAQIIIITHQKEVMQAADALYGITMDGYGTSKLMSLKMVEREGQQN
ncbi:MAG: chromosome segregation protein SMC [Candidatus Caldatribacteriota bacterium]